MSPGDPADGHPASTVDLIHRVREGDRRAFEELAQRFVAPLKRWASGRLPRRARTMVDTEDVVQEALMRTVQKLDVLEPRRVGGFQSYLRQAVINRVRDEVRQADRRPRGELPEHEPAGAEASPLEEALGREALARYEAALARLRPDDREAVLARMELGFNYEEIAVALGKPSRDAARMAISRAMLRLAKELARES